MPAGKRSSGGRDDGRVPAADLAELQAALAATLRSHSVGSFPHDDWASLAICCLHAGVTLVVSPQMDGRAVRLSVPIGTKRLSITAGTDIELEEGIRALILAVRKLPPQQ